MLDYIPDDGYTEEAYLAAEPFLHGEVRFTRRPMLPEQTSAIVDLMSGPDNIYIRKAAQLVAPHVKSWSILDAEGKPLPISAKNLLRLKRRLLIRIIDIVAGFRGGDVDPSKEFIPGDDAELESALTGKTVSEVRLEQDAGN